MFSLSVLSEDVSCSLVEVLFSLFSSSDMCISLVIFINRWGKFSFIVAVVLNLPTLNGIDLEFIVLLYVLMLHLLLVFGIFLIFNN